MAHMWVKRGADGWTPLQLDDGVNLMSADDLGTRLPARAETSASGDGATSAEAVVIRRRRCEGDTWVVAAPPGVGLHVNGWLMRLGLRVLRDKDQLRVGNTGPFFFSTERLPHVETMAEPASPTLCPRCKLPIVGGKLGVRCPRCGVLHHQYDELPCWYGYEGKPFERCTNCDQPVATEGKLQWTPEEL